MSVGNFNHILHGAKDVDGEGRGSLHSSPFMGSSRRTRSWGAPDGVGATVMGDPAEGTAASYSGLMAPGAPDRSPRWPRITPLAPDELVGPAAELLESVRVAGASEDLGRSNIFTTLVRAPRLFRRWVAFGGTLLSGELPARHREMLILRTAWNCRCPYEWGQHVPIGLRAGLGESEVRRLAGGAADDWEQLEADLVRAADQLHESLGIDDDTWGRLADAYTTEQLIEVPMLVGHYHLVAMTITALGVPLDDGLEGFPA